MHLFFPQAAMGLQVCDRKPALLLARKNVPTGGFDELVDGSWDTVVPAHASHEKGVILRAGFLPARMH